MNPTHMKLFSLVVVVLAISGTHSWDNGLARTPPMGWMSWLKYECTIDCVNHPNGCINEQLFKDMIDRIAEDGYLQLGYNTVNIDDCWLEHSRDPVTNRLVADRQRFPSGIKALADYARSKGVSLGIYQDVGNKTCQGYPGTLSANGSVDYTFIDAKTFSDWGVDSLKLDGCYEDVNQYGMVYPEYTRALSKQGEWNLRI